MDASLLTHATSSSQCDGQVKFPLAEICLLSSSGHSCSTRSQFSAHVSSGRSQCSDSSFESNLSPVIVKEVSDQELIELHYQHSFNARLILQALCRKLRFIREDAGLVFGASTSSATSAEDAVLLNDLSEEQYVLDRITRCFYDVDRSYSASFPAEFYVGFWDAWSTIRDIGRDRLVDDRYLCALEIIENARLDVYFPNRHADSSILTSPIRPDSRTNSLVKSMSQSDLYFVDGYATPPSQPESCLGLYRYDRASEIPCIRVDNVPRTRRNCSDNFMGPGDLRRRDDPRLGTISGHMRYHAKYQPRSHAQGTFIVWDESSLSSVEVPGTDTDLLDRYAKSDSEGRCASSCCGNDTIASFACRGLESILNLSLSDVRPMQQAVFGVRSSNVIDSRERSSSLSYRTSCTNSERDTHRPIAESCNHETRTQSSDINPCKIYQDIGNPSGCPSQTEEYARSTIVLEACVERRQRKRQCGAHAKDSHRVPLCLIENDPTDKLLPDSIFDHVRWPVSSVAQTNMLEEADSEQMHETHTPHMAGRIDRRDWRIDRDACPACRSPNAQAQTPKDKRKKRRVIPGLKTRSTRFELE